MNTRLWADVGFPPTFVIDFLHLGWPLGAVAGVCLLLAVIGIFMVLRRKGLHVALNIILCLLLFGGANFGMFLYGLSKGAEARERYRKKANQPPPSPEKETPFDIEKPPKI